MTTAQELINDAAKDAGVLSEGGTIEAGLNAQYLKRLNSMLARWENKGIDFGLGTLTAASTLYFDDADEECIRLQLQLRIMMKHKRAVPPGLSAAADEALIELQAKYDKIPTMTLDSALLHRQDLYNYNVNSDS